MAEGIKCYAVTIRAFVICEDMDGKELPPDEWPFETLLEELTMSDSQSGRVSVRAELVHEFLCDPLGEAAVHVKESPIVALAAEDVIAHERLAYWHGLQRRGPIDASDLYGQGRGK